MNTAPHDIVGPIRAPPRTTSPDLSTERSKSSARILHTDMLVLPVTQTTDDNANKDRAKSSYTPSSSLYTPPPLSNLAHAFRPLIRPTTAGVFHTKPDRPTSKGKKKKNIERPQSAGVGSKSSSNHTSSPRDSMDEKQRHSSSIRRLQARFAEMSVKTPPPSKPTTVTKPTTVPRNRPRSASKTRPRQGFFAHASSFLSSSQLKGFGKKGEPGASSSSVHGPWPLSPSYPSKYVHAQHSTPENMMALYTTSRIMPAESTHRSQIGSNRSPSHRRPATAPLGGRSSVSSTSLNSSSPTRTSRYSAYFLPPTFPPELESLQSRYDSLSLRCLHHSWHRRWDALTKTRLEAYYVTKLAYGRKSTPVIKAAIQLAEAYMQQGMYLQAIEHVRSYIERLEAVAEGKDRTNFFVLEEETQEQDTNHQGKVQEQVKDLDVIDPLLALDAHLILARSYHGLAREASDRPDLMELYASAVRTVGMIPLKVQMLGSMIAHHRIPPSNACGEALTQSVEHFRRCIELIHVIQQLSTETANNEKFMAKSSPTNSKDENTIDAAGTTETEDEKDDEKQGGHMTELEQTKKKKQQQEAKKDETKKKKQKPPIKQMSLHRYNYTDQAHLLAERDLEAHLGLASALGSMGASVQQLHAIMDGWKHLHQYYSGQNKAEDGEENEETEAEAEEQKDSSSNSDEVSFDTYESLCCLPLYHALGVYSMQQQEWSTAIDYFEKVVYVARAHPAETMGYLFNEAAPGSESEAHQQQGEEEEMNEEWMRKYVDENGDGEEDAMVALTADPSLPHPSFIHYPKLLLIGESLLLLFHAHLQSFNANHPADGGESQGQGTEQEANEQRASDLEELMDVLKRSLKYFAGLRRMNILLRRYYDRAGRDGARPLIKPAESDETQGGDADTGTDMESETTTPQPVPPVPPLPVHEPYMGDSPLDDAADDDNGSQEDAPPPVPTSTLIDNHLAILSYREHGFDLHSNAFIFYSFPLFERFIARSTLCLLRALVDFHWSRGEFDQCARRQEQVVAMIEIDRASAEDVPLRTAVFDGCSPVKQHVDVSSISSLGGLYQVALLKAQRKLGDCYLSALQPRTALLHYSTALHSFAIFYGMKKVHHLSVTHETESQYSYGRPSSPSRSARRRSRSHHSQSDLFNSPDDVFSSSQPQSQSQHSSDDFLLTECKALESFLPNNHDGKGLLESLRKRIIYVKGYMKENAKEEERERKETEKMEAEYMKEQNKLIFSDDEETAASTAHYPTSYSAAASSYADPAQSNNDGYDPNATSTGDYRWDTYGYNSNSSYDPNAQPAASGTYDQSNGYGYSSGYDANAAASTYDSTATDGQAYAGYADGSAAYSNEYGYQDPNGQQAYAADGSYATDDPNVTYDQIQYDQTQTQWNTYGQAYYQQTTPAEAASSATYPPAPLTTESPQVAWTNDGYSSTSSTLDATVPAASPSPSTHSTQQPSHSPSKLTPIDTKIFKPSRLPRTKKKKETQDTSSSRTNNRRAATAHPRPSSSPNHASTSTALISAHTSSTSASARRASSPPRRSSDSHPLALPSVTSLGIPPNPRLGGCREGLEHDHVVGEAGVLSTTLILRAAEKGLEIEELIPQASDTDATSKRKSTAMTAVSNRPAGEGGLYGGFIAETQRAARRSAAGMSTKSPASSMSSSSTSKGTTQASQSVFMHRAGVSVSFTSPLRSILERAEASLNTPSSTARYHPPPPSTTSQASGRSGRQYRRASARLSTLTGSLPPSALMMSTLKE